MADDLPLRCACGAVRGIARDVSSGAGNRLVCMCDDCQAYGYWLDDEGSTLDASGGTEVMQLTPRQIEITAGADNIQCVRLSAKGLMRWYAGCCRTPLFNGLASARIPFLSIVAPAYEQQDAPESVERILGPILARIHGRYGKPPLPEPNHARAPFWLIARSLAQLGRGFVSGAHQPSPVFTRDGRPVVTPHVVSSDERERLRDRVSAPR